MIVKANKDLSRNDLTIFIRGEDGGFIDPFAVTYSIVDAEGAAFSGQNLPALWQSPGTYYAPFRTQIPNGAYLVKWGIQYSSDSTVKYVYQNIFNLDPGVYARLTNRTIPSNLRPDPSSKTFIYGYDCGPEDLAIYFKDLTGVRFDPYAVYFSIREKSGRVTVSRRAASRNSVGHFWAPYRVTSLTGDFAVFWEFSRYSTDPLQSQLLPFSQINPSNTGVATDGDTDCGCKTDCSKPSTGCVCECNKTHPTFQARDC